MPRIALAVVLGFGALFGFTHGIMRLSGHHPHHHHRHSAFEERVARTCVEAARNLER